MVDAVTHQKRRLAGWDQAVGRVWPKGGARGIEAEGAETAAPEETVLASHRSTASTLGQVASTPLLVSFFPGVCGPRSNFGPPEVTPRDPQPSSHLQHRPSGAFPQMASFFFHRLVTTFASTRKRAGLQSPLAKISADVA